MLQQESGQTSPLVLVGHDERHLRLGSAGEAVEAANGEDLAVSYGHQREAVVMVDVGEAVDLGGRQVRMGPEVAAVHGVHRQPIVESDQSGAVIGTNRTDVHGRSIGKHGIASVPGRSEPGALDAGQGADGGHGPPGSELGHAAGSAATMTTGQVA